MLVASEAHDEELAGGATHPAVVEGAVVARKGRPRANECWAVLLFLRGMIQVDQLHAALPL